MIVLGIDPGTALTGYGVVERTGSRIRAIDYGCIETPAVSSCRRTASSAVGAV